MISSIAAIGARGLARPVTTQTARTLLQRASAMRQTPSRALATRRFKHDSSKTPPPLNVGKEHVNIMEEKAARAAQLHAELEQLLEKNEKRRKETSGFVYFLKQNASQFINIGVSFLCVVFAYQIMGMRQASRKLLQEKEDLQAELNLDRQVLQGIVQEEFLESVAEQCAQEMASNNNKSSWRNLGRFGGSASSNQDVASKLVPILKQNIGQFIGDAGLSSEEKKQKIVAELQKDHLKQMSKVSSDEKMLFKELQASQKQAEVVEVTENDDGTQIIKRKKFSI